MKWKHLVLVMAIALVACMAWSGVARAETVSSNISYAKTVTNGGGFWYPTDGSWAVRAVNGIGKGSTNSKQVLYSYQANSGLKIDLGLTTTIDSVEIWPKGTLWADLETAWIEGYEDDGSGALDPTKKVGDVQIPTGMGAATSFQQSVAWNDVRHILFREYGDIGTLTLTEIEVWGQVEAYDDYITTVTATSPHSFAGTFDPNWVCKGVGMLDSDGLATDPNDYLGNPDALSKNTNPYQWHMAAGTDDGYITFDLGGSHSLENMLIWNHNQTTVNTRGFKEVTIAYSTDGTTFTPLDDMNNSDPDGTDGNYTIPLAPTADVGYQLDVDLDGLSATHVRITEHSHWGGDYPGLSEVRFFVPEPSTLVGLLAIGLLCLVRRGRR